jgi:serine/threonine-protein kinase HipA
MAVGNADAHAKNFSVLHDADSPAISLAPLYDVLSTIALELTDSVGQPVQADTHLGQRVGGQADIRTVTAASLTNEAVSWGIRRRTAASVVAETIDRILAAIPETPGDPRVLDIIRKQTSNSGGTSADTRVWLAGRCSCPIPARITGRRVVE